MLIRSWRVTVLFSASQSWSDAQLLSGLLTFIYSSLFIVSLLVLFRCVEVQFKRSSGKTFIWINEPKQLFSIKMHFLAADTDNFEKHYKVQKWPFSANGSTKVDKNWNISLNVKHKCVRGTIYDNHSTKIGWKANPLRIQNMYKTDRRPYLSQICKWIEADVVKQPLGQRVGSDLANVGIKLCYCIWKHQLLIDSLFTSYAL